MRSISTFSLQPLRGFPMAEHAGWVGLTLQERSVTRHKTPSLVYAQAVVAMLIGASAIVATLQTVGTSLAIGREALWVSLVIYVVISILALIKLPTYPHSRFGPANVVTTLRAAATAMIGGIVLSAEQLTGSSATELLWFVTGGATAALTLDGLDGYLARRSGTSSRFGARFDMEVDALLILLLATAVLFMGKAGVWVLLIGLMRYGFLAAQTASSRLSGELPDSMRRKIVCVIQGAALCIAMAPIVDPVAAKLLLATALISLVYSFGADIVCLLNKSKGR